jgi:hypothetical protein
MVFGLTQPRKKFSLSAMPGTIQKNQMGVKYWAKMNSLKIYFLVISKNFALCVYGEYA